jgi:hypothetical protein
METPVSDAWLRRAEESGADHSSHPRTNPPETVERIRALAQDHPSFGCNRYEAPLALAGIRVSAITIQKILIDSGLGTRYDRWPVLEAKHAGQAIELSDRRTRRLPGESEPVLPGRSRGIRGFGRASLGGHLLRRHAQGHRQGPPACCGRLLHHAVVIQIEGASYRLRGHADIIPEHVRANAPITPPPPQKRRGRPLRNRTGAADH